MIKLWREFSFEAAHSLPDDRLGGPNARIHGHSYKARVTIVGTPDPETKMIVHQDEMERACEAVRFRLDHMNLNDVLAHTRPTMEAIAEFIAASFHVGNVVRVDVWRPTCGDGAAWERDQ